MENTFITSDLHFNHYNLFAKYCPTFRSDKFYNLMEMNEYILSQFDDLPYGSTVINLGDLFMSISLQDAKYFVNRMKANNKKLWLVLGNHDRSLPRGIKPKYKGALEELFLEFGFDKVFNVFEIDNYIFTHEPIYIEPNSTKINVHGHIHDCNMVEDYFCMKQDNYAMMKRVETEVLKEGFEFKVSNNKCYDKIININNYINVCWDKHGRILNIKEIINE